MSTTDLRCPACGSHVATRAAWCSLCFADLRGAPAAAGSTDGSPADPATEPVATPGVDPAADQARTADALLAELAVQTRRTASVPFGLPLRSRAARVGVTAGGAAAVAIALSALLAVLGSWLG